MFKDLYHYHHVLCPLSYVLEIWPKENKENCFGQKRRHLEIHISEVQGYNAKLFMFLFTLCLTVHNKHTRL